MDQYDVIAIGSGSSMNIISAMLQGKPGTKAAVIDKDDPGGICLTRGCIPTKILVYPAEVVRIIQDAKKLGIDAHIKNIDFPGIMARMRSHIDKDIQGIRMGLTNSKEIDYFNEPAEFIGPYQLSVGGKTITSKLILLCTGSEVSIPPIQGLENVQYHTSDTVLYLKKLPASIVIVGGGYIAAEYGHFFSAMGSKVTMLGRNPRLLPLEEPEISELALDELGKHMDIHVNHEVNAVECAKRDRVKVSAVNRSTGKVLDVVADEVMMASGRRSNSDILHPERAGIATDEKGWLVVNDKMETNQPGIYAFGDATGQHLFKHVANQESAVVFYNALRGADQTMSYHAVPHAVFTHPEIAGVGMTEAQAIAEYGADKILLGHQRYQDTAKGTAMEIENYFVKVIVHRSGMILGCHAIGPQASLLIQEVITLMYIKTGSFEPIQEGMHIHPSLSEVMERAFSGLRPPAGTQEHEQSGHQHRAEGSHGHHGHQHEDGDLHEHTGHQHSHEGRRHKHGDGGDQH